MKDLNQRTDMKSFVASQIVSLPKSGIRDFFELVNNMDGVISLGIGEPDFVTPMHIRRHAIACFEKGHTSYTSNLGLLSLRKEICRYVSQNYGVEYNPVKECIITVGVSEALDLILRAIINPGDEIIYHEPCYVSYSAEIKMAHGVPVVLKTVPENKFAVDPADVEKAITPKTKAILLNSPCNPTGAVIGRPALEKIAEIAKKHNLIVLTDEIYSELRYDDPHFSIVSLPGMKERTIFLHGFSKAFAMTGLRVGYACGPEPLIDAMMKIHQYSMLCAPTNSQEAAEEALRNGKSEMEKMRDEYHRRRDLIVGKLNEMGLPCVMPGGAFYAFPEIRHTGLKSLEFASRFLKEKNVALVPGTAFGPCGEGFVRCAYAASLEKIAEAMKRLSEFTKSLKK